MSGGAGEDSVHDGGVRWGRVSRGLYLLGLGTFLLLTTQDVLPWSFWSDALAYWPVLLVAVGLRLVFERSPAPALVLLGPILVLGTLMHVAMRGPARADTESEWVPLHAERPDGLTGWTLEGRLALASLDVRSRRLPRGALLEGRTTEAGHHSVRVAEEAAAGRVRVTNSWTERTFFVLPGRRRVRCELGITTALPVTVDLDLALTTTRIDLATSPMTRIAFDGALNDLSLRLGEPTTDVRLDLDGSFNQVVLEVPAATPVSVRSEGFLNLVDAGRGERGAQAGSSAGSSSSAPGGVPGGTTKGAPGYRLRLDGAFNRVVVRSW